MNYYQANAQTFIDRTINVDMSEQHEKFTSMLNQNDLILDAGCGSGRDIKAFLSMGFKVEAFDSSSKMVKFSSQYTGIDVKLMKFQELTEMYHYNGIWCCGSLLHVLDEELNSVLAKIKSALVSGGILYMSFKYGNTQRITDGRFFNDMTEEKIINHLIALGGVEVLDMSLTKSNIPNTDDTWINILVKKL